MVRGGRRFRVAAAVALAVSGFAFPVLQARDAVAVPNPPIWVASHYIDLGPRGDYYDLGYALGQRVLNHTKPQDAVVILDWGGQDNNSGTWGAITPNHRTFHSNSFIEDRSEAFGEGYFWGTGTDTTSNLTLLVGTNNDGPNNGGTAGANWANVVDAVANYFAGHIYGSQVIGKGANDLEFNFGSGSAGHDWASSYSNNTIRVYYDYGGCAGCIQENPSPWTMEQVYYVAWGNVDAFPFPEEFNQSGVKGRQWQQLAIYAHREHNNAVMDFQATLSQDTACDQEGNPPPCSGTNQPPDDSWTDMWKCLNTQCPYDGNTAPNWLAQGIKWSSNIQYTPYP